MRLPRSVSSPVLLAPILLLLAGCGGSPSAPKVTTGKEFIETHVAAWGRGDAGRIVSMVASPPDGASQEEASKAREALRKETRKGV